ncbi:hypothetical protein [Lacticaseibacillus absianus]|uniref:hypothetical protein n=1 Tax=Lacticaseibacillus absianus TaxID=2729623 RepID=UPI0015CB9306|nr:hypothetical protein [Lacticaseibacillus absianus]
MDGLWLIGVSVLVGLAALAGWVLLATTVAQLHSRQALSRQAARWSIALLGVTVGLDWLRAWRTGDGNAWLTTGVLLVLGGLIGVSRWVHRRGQAAVPETLVPEASALLAAGQGPLATVAALREAHPTLSVAVARHAVERARV